MKKRTHPHRITFLDPTDLEVVVLAKLGRSTVYIQSVTGLTHSQIHHRLAKAKNGEGYQKGHTYRSEWRDGTGALARQIENRFLPQTRTETAKKLQGLFEHPTPGAVKA